MNRAFLAAARQLHQDLSGQRFRTALTVLGIAWGTFAVSFLLAFGTGFRTSFRKAMSGMGEGVVIGWPGKTSLPFEGSPKGTPIRLDEDDIEDLAARIPSLEGISSEYERGLRLKYGDKATVQQTHGVHPCYAAMRSIVPQPGGRFINDRDTREKRHVVFLGDTLARDLFGPARNPVGETLDVGRIPFLVIGVMKPKNQDSCYSGMDTNMAFVPASVMKALEGSPFLGNFIFRARDLSATKQVTRQIFERLAERHRFDPADNEVIKLWDTTNNLAFVEGFAGAITLFNGIVGGMILLVAAISLANIMNVIVEERTPEIGIKIALGARPGGVLRQVLLEALILTGIGGAAGFAATGLLVFLWKAFLGNPTYLGTPVVSGTVFLLTIAILGTAGFLAGYFPARDAANVDPAVAMKGTA